MFFSPSASHLPSPPVAVRADSPLTFKESDPGEHRAFACPIILPLVRIWPSVKDGDATLAPLTCNPSHMAVRYEGRALGEDCAHATCRFDLLRLPRRRIASETIFYACCSYRPLTTKQVTRKMRRMMPPAMDTAKMVDWFGSPMAKTSVWGKIESRLMWHICLINAWKWTRIKQLFALCSFNRSGTTACNEPADGNFLQQCIDLPCKLNHYSKQIHPLNSCRQMIGRLTTAWTQPQRVWPTVLVHWSSWNDFRSRF